MVPISPLIPRESGPLFCDERVKMIRKVGSPDFYAEVSGFRSEGG